MGGEGEEERRGGREEGRGWGGQRREDITCFEVICNIIYALDVFGFQFQSSDNHSRQILTYKGLHLLADFVNQYYNINVIVPTNLKKRQKIIRAKYLRWVRASSVLGVNTT
jgi:hypothetical protein